MRGSQAVIDLAYGAGETPLVEAARGRGLPVADGGEVLLHQGLEQLRLFTGVEFPLERLREDAP